MPDTMWNDPFYRDLVPQRHHRPEPRTVMSGGRLDYAEDSTLTVDADFTFDDALDIANPMHHLPIVNAVYRDWTGDQISPHARVMGGAMYGPVGLMSATINVVMEQETGRDMAGTAIAIVTGEELAPAGTAGALAAAPAAPPSPSPSLPSVAMTPEDLVLPAAPVMPAMAAAAAAPRAPGALASVAASNGPLYDRAGVGAATPVPPTGVEIAAGPVIGQAPPVGVGPAPDPRPPDPRPHDAAPALAPVTGPVAGSGTATAAGGPVTISNGLDAALNALAAASEQGAAAGAIGGGSHSAGSASLAYQHMAVAGSIPLRRPSDTL